MTLASRLSTQVRHRRFLSLFTSPFLSGTGEHRKYGSTDRIEKDDRWKSRSHSVAGDCRGISRCIGLDRRGLGSRRTNQYATRSGSLQQQHFHCSYRITRTGCDHDLSDRLLAQMPRQSGQHRHANRRVTGRFDDTRHSCRNRWIDLSNDR